MTTGTAKHTVKLDWPIEIDGENGTSINEVTVRRPKGKAIKKLIALLGPDVVKALLGEVSKTVDATGKSKPEAKAETKLSTSRIAEIISSLATEEQLDKLSDLLASMTSLSADQVDEIDPADYPKFGEAFEGFFPGLFSDGEASPQT